MGKIMSLSEQFDEAEEKKLKEFEKSQQANLADDRDGCPVFLARNAWELDYIAKKWPGIRFNEVRERG